MSMRPRRQTARSRTATATANRLLRIILKAVPKKILKEIRVIPRTRREIGSEAEKSGRGDLILRTRLCHHCRALDSCSALGAGDDLFGLPLQLCPGARRYRYRAADGGPSVGQPGAHDLSAAACGRKGPPRARVLQFPAGQCERTRDLYVGGSA